MASSGEIINFINKRVDELTKQALTNVVEFTTKNAQKSFDRFVVEVPSDDPFVSVNHTPIIKNNGIYSSSVKCLGNQVLFIEFGAGVYHYTGDLETRLYNKYLGNLPSRPATIDDIGNYHLAISGRSRGQDDNWFYKSRTGRESNNAHLIKYNKAGQPIMFTHGNRPARALYRSIGVAMRRLLGGKL